MKNRKYLTWACGLICLGLFANLIRAFFLKGFSAKAIASNLLSDDVGLALFYFVLSVALFLLARYGRALFSMKSALNLGLILVSVVVALVAFDLLLKPFNLVFNSATLGTFNFEDMRRLADKKVQKKGSWDSKVEWMQQDKVLAYKPLMGPDYNYSKYGALHNSYNFEKPAGVTRVLFTGDSICALAYLTDNVKELSPKKDYEYWTTGVFGYATQQELDYFRRYGRKLKPDIVILEFCLNDWDGTPVILKDDQDKTIVANLYLGTEHFNYWLFKNSTLYRVYLSLMASATNRASLIDDVKRRMSIFQKYGEQDGFDFRVVVYPELDKMSKWPEKFLKERGDILRILKELNIKHYDVAPLLDRALAHHPRKWARLKPDDHFHPSNAFSRMIAEEVIKHGFLER